MIIFIIVPPPFSSYLPPPSVHIYLNYEQEVGGGEVNQHISQGSIIDRRGVMETVRGKRKKGWHFCTKFAGTRSFFDSLAERLTQKTKKGENALPHPLIPCHNNPHRKFLVLSCYCCIAVLIMLDCSSAILSLRTPVTAPRVLSNKMRDV